MNRLYTLGDPQFSQTLVMSTDDLIGPIPTKKTPAVKKVTVKKQQPKENPWARRIAERNIQIPVVESLQSSHVNLSSPAEQISEPQFQGRNEVARQPSRTPAPSNRGGNSGNSRPAPMLTPAKKSLGMIVQPPMQKAMSSAIDSKSGKPTGKRSIQQPTQQQPTQQPVQQQPVQQQRGGQKKQGRSSSQAQPTAENQQKPKGKHPPKQNTPTTTPKGSKGQAHPPSQPVQSSQPTQSSQPAQPAESIFQMMEAPKSTLPQATVTTGKKFTPRQLQAVKPIQSRTHPKAK